MFMLTYFVHRLTVLYIALHHLDIESPQSGSSQFTFTGVIISTEKKTHKKKANQRNRLRSGFGYVLELTEYRNLFGECELN